MLTHIDTEPNPLSPNRIYRPRWRCHMSFVGFVLFCEFAQQQHSTRFARLRRRRGRHPHTKPRQPAINQAIPNSNSFTESHDGPPPLGRDLTLYTHFPAPSSHKYPQRRAGRSLSLFVCVSVLCVVLPISPLSPSSRSRATPPHHNYLAL